MKAPNEFQKMTVGEMLEEAFYEGWRKGVEAFAVWRDGRQLVGTGRLSLSEAQRDAKKDAEPIFKVWLAKQRKAFDGDEGGH